jgi:hypothetical protein
LHAGRDAQIYLMYYLDLFDSDPTFPALMLYVMPLAPLTFGVLLDVGGSILTELVMGVLYATSIVAYSLVARAFGTLASILTAVALLVYPPYGWLFHGVSSDAIFAFGFSFWALLLVRTASAPSGLKFVLHGAIVIALVLTRPVNQILFAFAAFPLLLTRFSLRQRLSWAGIFLATALPLLAGWAAYNHFRYADFTVARNVGANHPLYRLFSIDGLVHPDNGPASRELAAAVRSDLLTKEPYRSYQVDISEFFAPGSTRTWADLASLSDRTWGWGSDYYRLYLVAWEAVKSNPETYLNEVKDTVVEGFTKREYLPPPPPPKPGPDLEPEERATQMLTEKVAGSPESYKTVVIAGRRLPKPTDGQLIPGSRLWWLASTPDRHITTDWSSFRHPRLRFSSPREQANAEELFRGLVRFEEHLPARRGSKSAAEAQTEIFRHYPTPATWLLLGALAMLVWSPRGASVLLTLTLLAGAVLVVTYFGEPPLLGYRVPLDPVFILFGITGITGARASFAQTWTYRLWRSTGRFVSGKRWSG